MLSVQTNMGANTALKNINTNSVNMNKSLERLSSGFRINNAADDAAGFAVSSKLDAQSQRLKAASLNASQAQAMVKMADAGVNEIQNMVGRIQTLAIQASSSNNAGELGKLDAERVKLESAINKIANSTNFNGVNLLNGKNASAVAISITQGTAGDGSATSLTTTAGNDGNISTTYSYTSAASTAVSFATGTLSAVTDNNAPAALTLTGTASFSAPAAVTFTATFATANTGSVVASADILDAAGKTITAGTAITAKNLGLTSFGFAGGVKGDTSTFTAATLGTAAVAAGAAGDTLTVTGADGSTGTAALTAGGAFSVTMSNTAVLTGTAAATLANSTVTGKTTVAADTAAGAAYAAALAFQVGADNTSDNQVSLDLTKAYTTTGLGLTGTAGALNTQTGAQAYITTAKGAMNTLITQRADLGATQNQVAFVQANLATSIEQTTASVSSIRDADMAAEMANFTKNKILTQASTSMLAQANQAAQNVLSLFR